MAVQANDFTYQIDVNYAVSGYEPVFIPEFGTSAIIDITVNNGNTTNMSQSYSFTDIKSISVSTLASGGTFQLTTNYATYGQDMSAYNLLTTNSSGAGVFYIGGQNNIYLGPQYAFYSDTPIYSNGKFIGIGENAYGYITLSDFSSTTSQGILIAGFNGSQINLSATNITSAVPEAGEWAMMLLGLPLVGWVVRRKQSAMQIATA
ncbi:hypothetical protein [Methylomonas sp. AM2-LC]|uniref:hypothetical protein n=1 Tax=Methylomonas sp. AM2-LC TaxID=3153301 RepID=UPI0032674EDC